MMMTSNMRIGAWCVGRGRHERLMYSRYPPIHAPYTAYTHPIPPTLSNHTHLYPVLHIYPTTPPVSNCTKLNTATPYRTRLYPPKPTPVPTFNAKVPFYSLVYRIAYPPTPANCNAFSPEDAHLCNVSNVTTQCSGYYYVPNVTI